MDSYEIFEYIEKLSNDEVNEKIALYLGEPKQNYCEDWQQTQRFINTFENLNMTIEISKIGGSTFDWQVEIVDDDMNFDIEFDAVQKREKLTDAVARCALEWYMFQVRSD